jgi:sugar phosphate isomerase/epimerase
MKSSLSHLRLSLLLIALAVISDTLVLAAEYEPKIGIQTWTLRNMDFDQVVQFAKEKQIKYLQMIDKHMSPTAPADETKRKKEILQKNGLKVYTFGVAGTSMDKEKNRKLFEFAKLMEIEFVVVEPRNLAEWDNLEELAKEYDVKLAIHNHGLESTYGDPATIQKILDRRDKRIGVCLDVGHVTGAGFDAAKVFREYNGRVWDIHLKDKKVEMVDGKKKISDVMIGTGQANFKGLFQELKKSKWDRVLAIETDNGDFAKSPSEYVDRAIKFVRENKP